MNRRAILATTAALACAGCLSGNGGGNGSTAETTDGTATTTEATETTGDTAETTATATETTTATPTATETATSTAESTTETTATTATIETDTPETTTATRTETAGETTTDGTMTNGTTTNGTATGGSTVDRSFMVRERDGKPGNTANVTIENGGSRVVVTGTITGKNGCQTAVLDAVRTSGGTLRIVVATERAADTGTMCTQALVGISYRATVTVESQPDSVVVVHRGANSEETVATAEPSG